MIRKTTKSKIEAAVQAGIEPTISRSGNLQLKFPSGGSAILARIKDGEQTDTAAGKVWGDLTLRGLPKSDRPESSLVLRGSSEYMADSKGKLRVLRTWNPSDNKFVYSSRGKRFFATKRTQVIISLPVRITGTNPSTQREWQRNSVLPISELSGAATILSNDNLSTAEKKAQLKTLVQERYGESPVYEASGEEWVVDYSGDFLASAMTTEAQGGAMRTRTKMDRPVAEIASMLGGARAPKYEWLPFPDDICKLAFED